MTESVGISYLSSTSVIAIEFKKLFNRVFEFRNCLNLCQIFYYMPCALILSYFGVFCQDFVSHDARIAPSSTCKIHPKIFSKSFAHKFKQFLKLN